jgi:uncharacterized membrane protein (DUF485 family)
MAIVSALSGLTAAFGHSWFGEKLFLKQVLAIEWPSGSLSAEAGKRLVRIAWHLPSLAWFIAGVVTIAIFIFPGTSEGTPIEGGAIRTAILFALGFYLVGFLANVYAIRAIHFGGVLLLIALVALVVAVTCPSAPVTCYE